MDHHPLPSLNACWYASPWSELAIGPWREDHYQGLVVWSVSLVNRHGNRYLYSGPQEITDQASAEAFARRVNEHIFTRPDFKPNPRFWYEIYPVYGSDAYCDAEPEIVAEERRAALEPEAFPDNRFAQTVW